MENHMWFSSCWKQGGLFCQLVSRLATAWKAQSCTAQGTTSLCGPEQLTPLVKSRQLGRKEGGIEGLPLREGKACPFLLGSWEDPVSRRDSV